MDLDNAQNWLKRRSQFSPVSFNLLLIVEKKKRSKEKQIIDLFRSRGHLLCKFLATKESREFNSHRICSSLCTKMAAVSYMAAVTSFELDLRPRPNVELFMGRTKLDVFSS